MSIAQQKASQQIQIHTLTYLQTSHINSRIIWIWQLLFPICVTLCMYLNIDLKFSWNKVYIHTVRIYCINKFVPNNSTWIMYRYIYLQTTHPICLIGQFRYLLSTSKAIILLQVYIFSISQNVKHITVSVCASGSVTVSFFYFQQAD